MAEMGRRSIANIVFIILLAGGFVLSLLGTLKFISAAMNGPY